MNQKEGVLVKETDIETLWGTLEKRNPLEQEVEGLNVTQQDIRHQSCVLHEKANSLERWWFWKMGCSLIEDRIQWTIKCQKPLQTMIYKLQYLE